MSDTQANAYDTDKLSDQELLEMGFKERRRKHKTKCAQKCTMCGRPVAEPVSSYKVKGFQFLEEGDSVHIGCAKKTAEALFKLAATFNGEEDA